MAFTKEQQLAIDTHGSNIIVSAGAGSGKTAVLTERIFKMLEAGYSITRLLVLTFTNSAAFEMKTRIKKRIRESGKLKDQLEIIDNAFITTFDSFALFLVRKYHYLLGISKDLSIVDSAVISLAKRNIVDNLFLELYEKNDDGFLDILTKFTHKSDKEFKKNFIKIIEKLEKVVDRVQYLDEYVDKNFSLAVIAKKIENYSKECNERLKDMILPAKDLYDYVSDTKYGESLSKLIDFMEGNHTYEEIKAFFSTFTFSQLKNVGEEVKNARDKFKKNYYDKYVKTYLVYNDTNEMYNAILDTKNYVETIIKIAMEYFNRINNYKNRMNLYEFDDIAMMSLELLRNNPDVLKEVKDSFDEILLDEYQDTSDTQEKFIGLISDNNVYMVGDIKQSIYRFRNANPYIFKEKYEKYKENNGGIKIDLNANFRSRKEVLNNINLLFSNLMHIETGDAEYKVDHKMNYGLKLYDDIDGNISYTQEYLVYEPSPNKEYSNWELETYTIVDEIKKLFENKTKIYDKDEKGARDIKYSDIAIIVSRKAHISTISKILSESGIPNDILIDEKVTESVVLRVIISLLNLVKYVDTENPLYDFYFSSVARSFLFNEKDNVIFAQSFNKYQNHVISDLARKVKKYSYENSVFKTFNYMLEEFSIYDKLVEIGDVKEHLFVINYLSNMVCDLASSTFDFYEIADHFSNIIESGLELKYTKQVSGNGVIIINIHKSKGLEYPICFFPDLSASFNLMDLNDMFMFDKEYGFIVPYFTDKPEETIDEILYKHKYIKDNISEEIRLFYVALTRAREKMYFIINKASIEKEVASAFLFKSFSDFIAYYYDEAIAPYVKNVNAIDLVGKYQNNDISTDLGDCGNKYEYNESNRVGKLVKKEHISSEILELVTKETVANLKFGTHLHEILETIDLKEKDLSKLNLNSHEFAIINKVINLDCFKDLKDANIYKELEFDYVYNDNRFHGIIDLLIEYSDHFEIIDYKLSNVEKDAYEKQLKSYKQYINLISNKPVKMYLLSILNGTMKEVFVEE